MNRKKLAAYGQEFEEEDEATSISKKPTPIHEEIATDEKGKRRFHGAFTGGFSAGYWNTVGSKHGWVPQEFSSSRDSRGDRVQQKADDFMDDEDRGEFGIGRRSIQQTDTFGSFSGGREKRKMAWERKDDVTDITSLFQDVVKPVSNSIGVRMLRSMGWREGRGIGLASVKQKQQRGGHSSEAQFDREQAAKIAPQYELANEDAIVEQLTPLTGSHGIGYQGLRHSTALNESYGQTALALKSAKKSSKGIRGQAFGVGAFEEEDESVYSNYDLSQFDFSLDVAGNSEDPSLKAQKVDTAFELQPQRLNPRKFYAPPRMPSNFRGEHRPIRMDVSRMSSAVKEDVGHMNALQRAKFLGENRVEVMEGGSGKGNDNEGKKERRSRWDVKVQKEEMERRSDRGGETEEDHDRRQRNRVEFPDEPQKQARFKEFLLYLRRGLAYPQPTDLTVWEWDNEKKEFAGKLTSQERALLPEVKSRSEPLARTAMSGPIFEMMASKFVKESGGDLKTGVKNEDKLAAVKMDMFGERTRQSFEWYPDALLAKRFNIPHPYPGAEMVGVPALQKSSTRKRDLLAEMGGASAAIGLPNTANEVQMRERLLKARRMREIEEKTSEDDVAKSESDDDEEEDVEKEEKAPKSFFDFVFGDGNASESSSTDDDDSEDERALEEERREAVRRRESELAKEKKEAEKKESDERARVGEEREKVQRNREKIDKEDDEIEIIEEIPKSFGPALPPKNAMTKEKVLKFLEKDLKKKKDKKEKKKRKKEKKAKKEKKKKSRRRDSTSGSGSDSDDWEERK